MTSESRFTRVLAGRLEVATGAKSVAPRMEDRLTNEPELEALIERARGGDHDALAELFQGYRQRLQRMIDLRLDRRLQGRVDSSDVLQEAYLTLSKKIDSYQTSDELPFFLWLRLVAGECLMQFHRRHLKTAMRDANMEVAIYRGPMPVTDSYSLAAQLLGKHTTASQHAMRAESKLMLQEALNEMDPIDREIIVLRHFEELSNGEVAQILEIDVSAASSRYFRAVRRLKTVMGPGM